MKQNDNRNADFERLLKSKMDELASSVDCFDKISGKVFPEKKADFSDDEYTVCDLENVTGRKKGFRFLPVAALLAAAAVCICMIPDNSGFRDFVYSHIGKSEKKVYREIINEINYEFENYSYSTYDCSLEEFISRDILVSPLLGCPFEEKDIDDVKVRIYTKLCGDIPTNQVYAVEYTGYSPESGNIIAAADSKAKFTDEELEEYRNFSYADFESSAGCFSLDGDYITDSSGTPITAAEIVYPCIFKYQDEVIMLNSQILYYHPTEDTDNNEYFYDIKGTYQQKGYSPKDFDTSVLGSLWNNAVYFNGTSAMAETDLSVFTKTDIYSIYSDDSSDIMAAALYSKNDKDSVTWLSADSPVQIISKDDNSLLAEILPHSEKLLNMWVVYLPDTGEDILIKSASGKINTSRTYESLTGKDSEVVQSTETEIAEYEQMASIEAEFEKNAQEAQNSEKARQEAVKQELNRYISELQDKLSELEKDNEDGSADETIKEIQTAIESVQAELNELENK